MLETTRLRLIPLNYEQLVKYALNDGSLERELGVTPVLRIVSPELIDALEQVILPSVANAGNNYLFSTLWTIIQKEDNVLVGDICFYGKPNEDGEVEIGYGIHEAFRGSGYMTEAVEAMVGWAAEQPGVTTILASTDKANIASYLVLEKNGFVKMGESDDLLHWKRSIR